MITELEKKRFWWKVNKNGPIHPVHGQCWTWIGAKSNYPHFQVSGSVVGAHRVSYEIHFGEIREGLKVLHKCDNRFCVNPEHLFAGTSKENSEDMQLKGRSSRGEHRPASKLTSQDVLEIRSLVGLLSQKDLSEVYGVSVPGISKIVNRKIWKHV